MLLNRTKMPKPYSIDLREKLFAQLDSGMSISKASKIFRVNRQTIYNWVSIKEETGKLEAKSGYQKGHSHKIKDLKQLELSSDNYNYRSPTIIITEIWS